jgi:valyl-tRNA synthetase
MRERLTARHTITIASLQHRMQEFDNEAASIENKFFLNSAKALRSLIAKYAFKEGAKTYIQSLDDKVYTTFSTSTSLPSVKSHAERAVARIIILSVSSPTLICHAVYTIGSAATAYMNNFHNEPCSTQEDSLESWLYLLG